MQRIFFPPAEGAEVRVANGLPEPIAAWAAAQQQRYPARHAGEANEPLWRQHLLNDVEDIWPGGHAVHPQAALGDGMPDRLPPLRDQVIHEDAEHILLEPGEHDAPARDLADLSLQPLIDDFDVALGLVLKDGLALHRTSFRLRADPQIVLAAVLENGKALQFASKELRACRKIVRAAVGHGARRSGESTALQFASAELRGDTQLVSEAVSKNGASLEFAAENCRADKSVVLRAVTNKGLALRYAAEEFREDEEVVHTAIQQDILALQFASHNLRGNRIFMEEVVKGKAGPYALRFASEELLQDPDFLFEAKQKFFFLKVMMMSGCSCIVASPLTDGRLKKEEVLLQCTAQLPLSDKQRENADLILGTTVLPSRIPLGQWAGLSPGAVTELQLLVSSSSSG